MGNNDSNNNNGGNIENVQKNETTVSSVMYAAERIDPEIKFTEEACARLVNVPRIFLPTALKGCVEWARENGVKLITEEHMQIINDKRAKEKSRK